jgi:hypothetical protein
MTTESLLRLVPVAETGERVGPTSSRYHLRVTLPDRPGALGSLAAALGKAGADIQSIAIVERDSFDAVDDITFQLADTSTVDDVYEALCSVAGIWVESLHKEVRASGLSGATALLARVAGAHPAAEWHVLVDDLPGVLGAVWAAIWPSDGTAPPVCASAEAPTVPPIGLESVRGPVATTAGVLWSTRGSSLLEVAIVPFGSRHALGVARAEGPPFREAELNILQHVADVAAALLGDPSTVEALDGGRADPPPAV